MHLVRCSVLFDFALVDVQNWSAKIVDFYGRKIAATGWLPCGLCEIELFNVQLPCFPVLQFTGH